MSTYSDEDNFKTSKRDSANKSITPRRGKGRAIGLKLPLPRISSRTSEGQKKSRTFKSSRLGKRVKKTRVDILKQKSSRRSSSRDDNSSNSDNSESNAIFNEINWEENLEVDTSSLLDEFAPRPALASPSSESQASPNVSKVAEVKEVASSKESKLPPTGVNLPVPMEPDGEVEFTPGCRIHVMDYNTTSWCPASVIEVDWEEEEVLVHYENNLKSDEWVSMNSQRLARSNPDEVKPPPIEAIEAVVSSKSPLKPKHSDDKFTKESSHEQVKKKTSRSSLQRRYRREKNSELGSHKQNTSFGKEKFEVGEKVLAKWSDHRMQKFPAVIKRIIGNGKYDVLFYDGFEKTILGEDLYKTTEEEVAKYQHSNPSEADTFVDMEIGAKEERRQRKRKTFDDYLFEKDFHRSRKKSFEAQAENKSGGIASIDRKVPKRIYEKSESDIDPTSPVARSRKVNESLQTLSHSKRKTKRKERESKSHLEASVSGESSLHLGAKNRFDQKSSDISESVLDDSSERTLSAETSISMDESGSEATPLKKVPVSQLPEGGERWIGDIPEDVHPLKIVGIDGIPRKTVVIPDKNLPSGWVKHAVLRKTSGRWDAFLITLDGYKLQGEDDLKDYFREVKLSEPSEGIDFTIYSRALPELAAKQKDLSAKGNFKKWERKRGRRRKIPQMESHSPVPVMPHVPHQVGRVKTLLPKYRTTSPVTSVQPSSPAPPAGESEVWRCPKQGCDKKFRKENLLQMHIKHYHVEFKALVGSAPNVVDLACARSESVNSDWGAEQQKLSHATAKRTVPKSSAYGPSGISSSTEKAYERQDLDRTPASQIPSASQSPMQAQGVDDSPLIKRQLALPIEEKKSTIKTILPLRQPVSESTSKMSFESDEGPSDDETSSVSDAPKSSIHPSRFYKIGRMKKIRPDSKFASVNAPMDDVGMRDHGYPMYSGYKGVKRKQIPAIDKLQITTDSNDSYTEEEKASPNAETMDETGNIERLRSEEIINCRCGFKEEDGLMIQCDICLCWQHGFCCGVEKEKEVPDRYVCYTCREPPRVRSSKKYAYSQIYLTQANLPTLSFRTCKPGEVKQRESMLKRCFDLTANLHQIQNVERSLRAKISIAQQSDHPKLYLWAKNWDESANVKTEEKEGDLEIKNDVTEEGGEDKPENSTEGEVKTRAPEPEAPIDLEDCRLKLLDHVEHYQHQIETRLSTLQAQVAALESQDPDLASEEATEHFPLTKQTVHMLLRDLTTIRKVSAIS